MKYLFKMIMKKILYIKNRKFNRVYDILDFSEIEKNKIKKVKRIIFIIPGMLKYSGGHTSILRLGTQLSTKYKIEYISYQNHNISTMEKAAYCNLKNYRGSISNIKTLKTTENDILIATSWESVYYMKNLKGYKMYFIQDYEPYFYTYGEKYIFAEKTYEFGLHMVSLGYWNVEMIKRKLKNKKYKLDWIEFPYEKKEYFNIERNYEDYRNKKEIKLCVYVKDTEKRIPFLIEKILLNLKEQLKSEGINLRISYFGNENYLKLNGGNNLGKLSKKDLNQLYCESDFGMCASLTNISLVPYEMLATGLPIIEFKEGSFEYFFGKESGILIDFEAKELKEKILESLKEPDLLKKRNEVSKKILTRLSWEKTVNQFMEIINRVVE